jgi:hypothetical protein
MEKDAGPYFTRRIEMLSPRERWFAALLFAFKLFAVAMIIVPIVWRMTLPAKEQPAWYPAAEDFSYAIHITSPLCLVAATIVLIGGIIQLVRCSRRAGIWSIAFGGLALAIGIFMASHIPSLSLDALEVQTIAW